MLNIAHNRRSTTNRKDGTAFAWHRPPYNLTRALFLMMQSNIAPSGMAVTPHHLASAGAQRILR
ncbi:hypothetical protein F7096_14785, partial [Dickeya dianthicola]|nr:hypothetical protein [Dickeya dianthicola]MBI0511715.1 hypothetical protein [Dickeya dianthicola]MBI0543819.1 hypothetical protein [Dickeya dianthicola]